jgi:chromosome partitioning protein
LRHFVISFILYLMILGVVSQKGGVGKSTVARLVAREYANANWAVKICDLDVAQGTSFSWQARRLRNKVEPVIPVERFGTVDQALKIAGQYDLLILDGPPHSTSGTLRIVQAAELSILPSGLSLDDLEPSVLLAHELVKKGISRQKLAFALCRVGDNESEIQEAREYIREAGYTALKGEIPERTAYRRATDSGRAPTETAFPSLNSRADTLAQSIVDALSRATKKGTTAHG